MASGGAQDQLLAALIGKLPPVADNVQWPRAGRVAWLELMARAFNVVYGPEEPIDIPAFLEPRPAEARPSGGSMAAAAVPAARPAPHAAFDFHITLDGLVLRADGTPAFKHDVPPETQIFDPRPVTGDFRDLAGITWADGERGTAELAGGISFCGPGRAAA